MLKKQEALQVLAKYLPPPVLSEFMQFWWASGLEQQASANGPQVDGKRMSYAESQRLGVCPYCGDPGIPYGDEDFEDVDYDKYQCSNLHVFYVSKEAQA